MTRNEGATFRLHQSESFWATQQTEQLAAMKRGR